MKKWILKMLGVRVVAAPLIVRRECVQWGKPDAEVLRNFLESEPGKKIVVILRDAIAEDAQKLRPREFLLGGIATLDLMLSYRGHDKNLEQDDDKAVSAMWVKEEDETN